MHDPFGVKWKYNVIKTAYVSLQTILRFTRILLQIHRESPLRMVADDSTSGVSLKFSFHTFQYGMSA